MIDPTLQGGYLFQNIGLAKKEGGFLASHLPYQF